MAKKSKWKKKREKMLSQRRRKNNLWAIILFLFIMGTAITYISIRGRFPNAQIDAVAIPYEEETEEEEDSLRFGNLKLVPLHRIDFDELER